MFFLKCQSSILFCSGNYDVLEDDESAEDISVTLKDERQRVLWKSVPGESEGTFELHVNKGGRFSLCLLNNGDKEDGDRTVGFALRVRGRSRALGDKEQGPDGEKALELISWAEELTEEWDTLLDHYDYLRSREAVHEELGDKIFKRVMRWTLVEAGFVHFSKRDATYKVFLLLLFDLKTSYFYLNALVFSARNGQLFPFRESRSTL
jgi:hypothetical protein